MIKFYLLSALFFFSSVLGQQGTLFINEFMASNAHTIQDEYGDYADWIEIYNASDSTINLGGFFISDDANNLTRWRLPDTSDLTAIESKGFIVLWADADTLEGALHLGFKLSASGESIFLTDSNGTVIIDQVYFPEQFTDISYGRQPDASENWYFLNQPTPGSGNINIGLTDKANPPEFSLDGGFYTTSQEITITSEYPDSLIFYTLNGSMPTIHSHRYIGPFNINSSSIIRARVIKDDLLPSDATSHSYFINNELLHSIWENYLSKLGLNDNIPKNGTVNLME